MDRELSFDPHVSKRVARVKRARERLMPLLHKSSGLSKANKITIIARILLPITFYACPTWVSASFKVLQLMTTFQQMAIRTATAAPYFVRGAILEYEARLPTVQEEIQDRCLKYYESLDSHTNHPITNSIRYPINTRRKYKRPRDCLLQKPP